MTGVQTWVLKRFVNWLREHGAVILIGGDAFTPEQVLERYERQPQT